MRVVLVKLQDGRATVNATRDGEGDYWRKALPDEIIEGMAVRDWPPGVHELRSLPPEPRP